jgi:hypothetical protein
MSQTMLLSSGLQPSTDTTDTRDTNNPFTTKDDDYFVLDFKDDIKDIKYDRPKENDYFIEVTEDELISRLMEETDQDMKEFCKYVF